jgi:hypothetical protein
MSKVESMAEHISRDGNKEIPKNESNHLTDRVIKWCQSDESVSSLLATNPGLSPDTAWKNLFGDLDLNKSHHTEGQIRRDSKFSQPEDKTQDARSCGKWGSAEPSELFLQVSLANI